MNLTGPQIKALCLSVGFTEPQAEIMAAIALEESNGNPDAHALTIHENSWGLYQINLYAHKDVTMAQARSLAGASAIAYRISKQGTDFTPWTVYKTGAYKKRLPIGPATPLITGDPPVIPGEPGIKPDSGGLQLPTNEELKQAGINLLVGGVAVVVAVISIAAMVNQTKAGKAVVGLATKGVL